MNNIYTGVYGIFIESNKILLIKKARGPYRGMYDLPGGGIEFGENIDQCLKREIGEETGGKLIKSDFLGINEYICEYKNQLQQSKNFHHIGFYYTVLISCDDLKTGPDGEDSLGAEYIDISELHKVEISPIARPMIEKAIVDYTEKQK